METNIANPQLYRRDQRLTPPIERKHYASAKREVNPEGAAYDYQYILTRSPKRAVATHRYFA